MNPPTRLEPRAVRFAYRGASFRDMAKASGATPRFIFRLRDPRDRRPTYSYMDLGSELVLPAATGEEDVFAVLDRHLAAWSLAPDPGLPPFQGGLLTFIGYDAAGGRGRKSQPLPDYAFLRSRMLLAIDHARAEGYVIALAEHGGASPAHPGNDGLEAHAARFGTLPGRECAPPVAVTDVPDWTIDVEYDRYASRVERIKRMIASGAAEQVILSIGMCKPADVDPFAAFDDIFERNPSPHSYLLALDNFTLIGCSPVLHLRKSGETLTVETDGGTMPLGTSAAETRQFERELLSSAKFRAELESVVGGTIEDLRSIAAEGEVETAAPLELRRFSHVMHPYTVLTARLRTGVTTGEALRVCSPAVAVTGRPKVAALAMADAIEEAGRGPYGGVIGLLGFDGSIETAVVLRSFWIADGKAYLRSGGGIVQASEAGAEYAECLHKARIVLESVAAVEAANSVDNSHANSSPSRPFPSVQID
jgi:anthranilate synthase component 1